MKWTMIDVDDDDDDDGRDCRTNNRYMWESSRCICIVIIAKFANFIELLFTLSDLRYWYT